MIKDFVGVNIVLLIHTIDRMITAIAMTRKGDIFIIFAVIMFVNPSFSLIAMIVKHVMVNVIIILFL